MNWITLATEDELSEEVGLRLAEDAGLIVHERLRRGGFGYLKSRVSNFCEMAVHVPVLMLTDLDRVSCAPALIADWLGERAKPPGFLFRVAVREIESWLLADHPAMNSLLGPRVTALPDCPDQLSDPKQTLLTLAQRAQRAVREDLLIRQGANASQGLGYNARLGAVVRKNWSPSRAAERSPSLARTRKRLQEFVVARGPQATD